MIFAFCIPSSLDWDRSSQVNGTSLAPEMEVGGEKCADNISSALVGLDLSQNL